MKVFIAGATGAGGRSLVQQLLDAGHDVQLENGYAQNAFVCNCSDPNKLLNPHPAGRRRHHGRRR